MNPFVAGAGDGDFFGTVMQYFCTGAVYIAEMQNDFMRKNTIIGSLVMIVLIVMLSACQEDFDETFGAVPYYVTIGDVVRIDDSSYYIDSDKGNKLYVENYQDLDYAEIGDGDRIYAHFLMLEKPMEGYTGVAHLEYIYKVLTKEPVTLTVANDSEMGNDPIGIFDIWCSDKYLNFNYQYIAGYEQPYVESCRD